jgi:hypothetical protein
MITARTPPVRGVASGLLAWTRLGVGVGCLVAVAVVLVVHLPRTVHTMDSAVRFNSYLHTPQDRLLTSGDMQGLPYTLQAEALRLIPPGSDYTVLLPATPEIAAKYGINSITFQTAPPFLRYLLLPSWPVDASQARFVICFGCDTAPWDHRTHWLWSDDRGNAIGRVES